MKVLKTHMLDRLERREIVSGAVRKVFAQASELRKRSEVGSLEEAKEVEDGTQRQYRVVQHPQIGRAHV